MSVKLKSARGHAKNARNKLRAIETAMQKDNEIREESIEYTLSEVEEAIEQINEELQC